MARQGFWPVVSFITRSCYFPGSDTLVSNHLYPLGHPWALQHPARPDARLAKEILLATGRGISYECVEYANLVHDAVSGADIRSLCSRSFTSHLPASHCLYCNRGHISSCIARYMSLVVLHSAQDAGKRDSEVVTSHNEIRTRRGPRIRLAVEQLSFADVLPLLLARTQSEHCKVSASVFMYPGHRS